MPELEDVTLYSLTKAMGELDQLYREEPDVYEDFVREICANFTLAREYVVAVGQMSSRGADRNRLAQADLLLRHMLALWVVRNDLVVPLSTPDAMQ